MAAGPDATALQVLRHLVDHGPLSRPDLQQGTGLARATTSAVVNDLMRRDLVAEVNTPRSGQRGRPVTLLDLDDTHYAVTGIEIGFDKILASVHTLQGRELLRIERPAEADAVNPRALLRRAAMVLQETLDLVEDDDRDLLGVGVSVAGLVDAASGTIKYAPSLGWRDIALREGVAEALGGRVPVLIDNTANYAALAELRQRRRSGGTEASLVYLTGTYGISAGIVAGGNLWRGERGMAGEVGHLIVEAGGLRCVCGRNGCLDTRAGVSAILDTALAAAKGIRRPSRVPLTLSAGVDQVAALAQAGDQGVIEALAEAGRWLGRGAALVCAMLDPHSVVLGGHYARLAPWLLDPAREAFRQSLLLPGDDREQLQVSALGAWAPVEGAALAVLLSYADGARTFPAGN
ncbi:ROK family protein [Streptacidiphilus sp. MAP5-3]|jgi:predicted NBD/HSP70 family sugar kinase|uniref:ROK family protein n=1 Tax=unclassified Streptacidiphilus TaxID=2643834 RepID=UPI003512A80A